MRSRFYTLFITAFLATTAYTCAAYIEEKDIDNVSSASRTLGVLQHVATDTAFVHVEASALTTVAACLYDPASCSKAVVYGTFRTVMEFLKDALEHSGSVKAYIDPTTASYIFEIAANGATAAVVYAVTQNPYVHAPTAYWRSLYHFAHLGIRMLGATLTERDTVDLAKALTFVPYGVIGLDGVTEPYVYQGIEAGASWLGYASHKNGWTVTYLRDKIVDGTYAGWEIAKQIWKSGEKWWYSERTPSTDDREEV